MAQLWRSWEYRPLVFWFGLSCAQETDGLDILDTGRKVTGNSDGPLTQYPLVLPGPTYNSESNPYWVGASDTLMHSQNSPVPMDLHTNHLATETPPEYIMELCIVTTKAKTKCGKTTKDFKMMKPLMQLLVDLTYLEFLKRVAKAANVHVQQLDCEHMHWKFRKLASATLTGIFEDESYSIMLQAICLKKDTDCWIVVEMGKLLLSSAVGVVLLFVQHTTKLKNQSLAMGLTHKTKS